MTYQYIRLHRIREHELEKAVDEKIMEGWELHTPILPITKSGAAWGIAQQGKYSIDHYKGSYMTQKFFCTMRREINVMNKSEARKRVATINQGNMELVNELFGEIEQLKKENEQLKKENEKLTKSIVSKEKDRSASEKRSKRLDNLNNQLGEETTNLRLKVEELTEKLSHKDRRAVSGKYPAVIKNKKKYIFLGVFDSIEEAEKREREAYEVL